MGRTLSEALRCPRFAAEGPDPDDVLQTRNYRMLKIGSTFQGPLRGNILSCLGNISYTLLVVHKLRG